MSRDTIQLETAVNTISHEYLLEFTSEYGISEALHSELSGPEDRIVVFLEGKRTSASKDGMVADNTYSPEAVMILNTHRTPIQKQPEALLCLVGLSRRYYLGDEVYLTFLHDDDRDMDLFSLFRAPNPTKVKTSTLPRAAYEVPLLTVTASRVIQMEDPAAGTDLSRVPSTIERSSLDFANENPSQQSTGPKDQGLEAVALEVPPPRMGNDGVDTNAPPKVLRKDHVDPRPTESTRGRKSLAAIELGMGFTHPVPASQGAPMDVNDPDLLSFTDPQSRPLADVTQPLSEQQPFVATGVHSTSAGYGRRNLKAAFEEFKQYKDNQVEQRCTEIDARLDVLSIDFDEELYLHMLTVITDIVFIGIAKGMSEGCKNKVKHGKANLSLEAIEAYNPEAEAKYITALHALKDLKYPILDQLWSLKDAPMDVIMAFLHLKSDTIDDDP
nr:hypothetical protein [Tanacetum cinerariifolium]